LLVKTKNKHGTQIGHKVLISASLEIITRDSELTKEKLKVKLMLSSVSLRVAKSGAQNPENLIRFG